MRGFIAASALLASSLAAADPQHPTDDSSQPHTEAGLTDADLLSQATALAEKEEAERIEIHGDAPAESASSVHLDRDTLAERSRTQMSDLLRNVPGLVVSQHAGGGKADQYFIRGFDADHGTDLAVFADGVPVNITSHGHGQGYADTHWLIPETIEAIDVHKGPYAARFGDFYTAGALELKTIDQLDSAETVWLSGGTTQQRIVGMASPIDKSLLAVQLANTDGPFDHPQGFGQANALVKWQGHVGARGWLKLEGNWYSASWHASGEIPDSFADRFGAIDPSQGGITSRSSLRLAYSQRGDAGATWRASVYGVDSRLRLFSNFTYFAKDPVQGDGIEQTDARLLYGADAAYERPIHRDGLDALITAGTQVRTDDVQTSLWHDAQRVRLANENATDNHIRDFGAYVEANVIPTHWLHIFPGVRIDAFTWDVTGTTTGSAQRVLASPKLSFEVHESDQVNLFANFGGGFHSNDARAAVTTHGDGALARAWGGEFGARVRPAPRTRFAMDVWYLWLSSELVWNGDEGGTEAAGATQRLGFDMEGELDATPWLALDANVTFSHSSFVDNASNGNALALAPRWMGSGGARAHGKLGYVTLRARGIGDRPGNSSGTLTAQGYIVCDLVAGHNFGKLATSLTINNMFNSDWREAQFAEISRITPTADLMEQMHYTPGVPFTATATAAYSF